MRSNIMNNVVHPLIAHVPQLSPKASWKPELQSAIQELTDEDLYGTNELNAEYAEAFRSGLYLWNESLQESHAISQGIHNQTGSYWHGIMHRMEGDYSNSKYWFRQVGNHPIFDELCKLVNEVQLDDSEKQGSTDARVLLTAVAGKAWKPDSMIDEVEKVEVWGRGDTATEKLLRRVQHIEMKLLLAYSFQASGGGSLFESY